MSPAATLAPASLDIAFDRDCADLLTRYVSAVGGYVVGYKTPILLVAIAGLVFACMQKRAAAVIALGIFAAIYLAMLYWYHLTCFGDYYFAQLNSIERFTRVVLQPLHALGLLAFATGAIYLAGHRSGEAILGSWPVCSAMVAAGALLAEFLTFHLNWTLVDISTRADNTPDHRIAEVRTAAAFVGKEFEDRAPARSFSLSARAPMPPCWPTRNYMPPAAPGDHLAPCSKPQAASAGRPASRRTIGSKNARKTNLFEV